MTLDWNMGRWMDIWRTRPGLLVAALIGVLCVLRLVSVIVSPLELGPDEAQYWRWSRDFDWGYYSKPPLIAWVIGASTAIFGDHEWAIRFLSPIAHAVAAFCLFLLGRRMFDTFAGAWAAALYLLMPGVWLSSTVMSTDALLLPCWSLALLALWRLRDSPTLANGAILGVAIGVGMLAKYAVLYFILGAALAAILDPATRRALLSLSGLVALAVVLLVLAPNLLWNAAHDFETISHTSDNANWSNAAFDPTHLLKFLADQFGVFGPLSLALLIGAVFVSIRQKVESGDVRRRWLLCFILPPLLFIAIQAFIARAHANWAATAYPAASVLVGSFVLSRSWKGWIVAAVALNAAIGAIYTALAVSPTLTDTLGVDHAFKRARGWNDMTHQLADLAAERNASALMFDEREPWHGADFYGRDLDLPPVRLWRALSEPQNFAEGYAALQPGEDDNILFASMIPGLLDRISADFETFEPAGEVTIRIGPDRYRVLHLYTASGFTLLPRNDAYFERFGPKD